MYTVEVDIKWAPFQDQIHQHHIPYIYIYISVVVEDGAILNFVKEVSV